MALHWVRGKGNYKQFVSNRVKEIQKKSYIQWRYVPTEENPADVASRGCSPQNIPTDWWSEPKWLQDQSSWPPDMATGPNNETESEAKVIKELLSIAVGEDDQQDDLLTKYRLWKTLQIKSWISRFITNCRTPSKERIKGHITTIEINAQKHQLIQNAQNHGESFEAFKIQKQTLNLQRNSSRFYECRGRIHGHYPLFIPRNSMLAEKIVEDAHNRTLHGGVSLTMSEV